MPLQKQPVTINFVEGLDTKSDPYQIPIGRFVQRTNSVYSKTGRLDKRNGNEELTRPPNHDTRYLTTFKEGLVGVGSELTAFSTSSEDWTVRGEYLPVRLETQPLIRNNLSQMHSDSATHPNGLICVVTTDDLAPSDPYRYSIIDSRDGQVVVSAEVIPSDGVPRVFVLANYFIITYSELATLKYIAINANDPTVVTAPSDLSTQYSPGADPGAYDGFVANNRLYIALNGTDGGGAIRVTYLNSTLSQGGTEVVATEDGEILSVCADLTTSSPEIYISYYRSGDNTVRVFALDSNLNSLFAVQDWTPSDTVLNITSSAKDGQATIFCEIDNDYGYAAIPTHFIEKNTVTNAGTLGSLTEVMRSVGIGSKSFIMNDIIYVMGVYDSDYQPTLFLLREDGFIGAKLAYSNASGYLDEGLPSATVNEDELTVDLSYLMKTILIPVNKEQDAPASAASFSQVGVNWVRFQFDPEIVSSEIGGTCLLTGGYVWSYDGLSMVEQGFHLWPDDVECVWSATGGSIHAQPSGSGNADVYYYQVTYEWMDNQGNIHRSAPSVPVPVTTTGSGTSGSITVSVPTLRLTLKTSNPVKIVIYRWSVAQQTFYQVTSIVQPVLNDTTVDSVSFVDTLADASIIGNSILYTTGGVLENIGAPAADTMTLYGSRFFMVSGEDGLVLYSKQVLPGTPVEMNNLFSLFVAPTTGAQGSTGRTRACAPLDDKLILFKSSALYYIVGRGPDNTGGNNDFSDPVFINSPVGSSNQNSIAFQPNGLMFESDGKGIWILKRDLSTDYIGADVEDYTQNARVLFAVSVPGTNEVRFTLDSGVTLVYDYYYDQWDVTVGVSAISTTLYENLPTHIDSYGRVFQETPGLYKDGSRPINMGFQTGWINVAGLQGYERAYMLYLLGTYYTPHKLQVDIAYDYNPSVVQSTVITPSNYAPNYGDAPGNYGDETPYGGPGQPEKWRVFFDRQKCEAFQLTVREIFDSSFGVPPGRGLSLSGMNLIIGVKSGYPRRTAAESTG